MKRILATGKVAAETATITVSTESDLWAEAVLCLMDQGCTQISVKTGEKVVEVEGKRN